jgi:ribosomal protein S18 acetylase RimI-like enzyme
MAVTVRPVVQPDDIPAIEEWEQRTWRVAQVARLGELIDTSGLPGFWALDANGTRIGLLLVRPDPQRGLEVISLSARPEGSGAGRALMNAALDAARDAGERRLWLSTTNDNTRAIRFYQRWGMDLVALHRDAVTRSRENLKPSIPMLGQDNIPLRHEIELERLVD